MIEIKKAKEFIQSLTKKYQIIVEDARSAHETITYNIGWISESSSKIQEGPKTPKLSSAKPRNQDSMLPLGSSSRKMHNNSKLKITVNTKNQTYGTFKVVVLLSVFCLALNWYEVLTSYGVLRSLVKVNGEVYTYKSLSRILTTHRTVLASLNSMTVWQNSLSVLHSPSKNTLEMNLKKYSSVDSKEWNEIQDKNLGDFRNQYDESSKNFNYCGSWLKQVYPKIKGCGVGSASILNGSLDRVLDQINSEIGFIVNSASTGNYNQLWSDLKFKTIQFYSVYLSLKKRSISAKMLNTIMNPLFDFLYNNLENDILGETTILTHLLLSLVVYLLVFILIGTYLRKSLENIGNYFFGTLLILPIQLLSTNPWISNKVKHRYLLVY